MVTVTFDELELNAVLAALDDRISAMSNTLMTLAVHPESRSREFAIECSRDALRDATRAQLKIADALPDVDYPEDATFAGTFTANGSTWSVIERYQGEGR